MACHGRKSDKTIASGKFNDLSNDFMYPGKMISR